MTATGLLVVSTLFAASALFSMNRFVSIELIQQAFAQEQTTLSQFPFSLEQDAMPKILSVQFLEEDAPTEGNVSSLCYYEDSRYSEGSIVNQGGITNECRTGQWVDRARGNESNVTGNESNVTGNESNVTGNESNVTL
jgi:Protein of unknown function (DUF1496)